MTIVKIKKHKAQKSVSWKKLKYQNYINCLEETQLDNKINYLEQNETNIDFLKKDWKEFIKNNKFILKTQLYVVIISCTRFRVNLRSIVALMSRKSLLKTDAISEV